MKDVNDILIDLKNNDRKAFEKLYEIYYERLCKYVFSLSSNVAISQDIVQEVLMDIWVKRQDLKINTSLHSYLYRVAYHRYIDFYRKEKKERNWLDTVREEAIIDFEDAGELYKKERLDKLKSTIERLPPKRKEIFVLNKLKNYRYKEVATLLGISERTVESQIRKALIFIKSEIKRISIFFYIIYGYYIN